MASTILNSLGSLVFGDASAAGQMTVDNRTFSQKFGSWESDRKRLTEQTPEEMAAQLAMTLRKREAVVIKASSGLAENGERIRGVTGYVADRGASTDPKIGVTSTGTNYAHFAAMSGRIAA
jgi:hypothetical protein